MPPSIATRLLGPKDAQHARLPTPPAAERRGIRGSLRRAGQGKHSLCFGAEHCRGRGVGWREDTKLGQPEEGTSGRSACLSSGGGHGPDRRRSRPRVSPRRGLAAAEVGGSCRDELTPGSVRGVCAQEDSFVVQKHVLWAAVTPRSLYSMNLLFSRKGALCSRAPNLRAAAVAGPVAHSTLTTPRREGEAGGGRCRLSSQRPPSRGLRRGQSPGVG